MFKSTEQVQTINVNEWVERLLEAQNAVHAVEVLKKKLSAEVDKHLTELEQTLKQDKPRYAWEFNRIYDSDEHEELASIIDYDPTHEQHERYIAAYEEYLKREAEKNA